MGAPVRCAILFSNRKDSRDSFTLPGLKSAMLKHYYTVTGVEEALQLLDRLGPRARIVAGGTDIIIEMERGLRPGVDTLIDISRVPGLDAISQRDGRVHLGPLVTHNHVVGSELMAAAAFPLAQAAWSVGAPQIRNRGTVAGNVMTASPANDTISPLMALDATVTLRALSGERTLPLADFYQGVRKTVARPDELLVDIAFAPLATDERGAFLKLGLRRAQAISVINLAVILGLEGARVRRARVALGSVAPTVIRATEAEAYLQGRSLTAETTAEAARLTAAAATPIDDVRGTAAYRSEMVRVLVRRALRALADGRERDGWPAQPAMLWGPDCAHVTRPLPMMVHHERDAADTIMTTVNGQPHTVHGAMHKTLLRMLREDLGLTGTLEGCAEGECVACTVWLDGAAVMACMVSAPRAHGAQIVTVEGLAHNGQLHPIQQAFIEEGAVQCGYCTPGFLMSGARLLSEHPHPTQEQIVQSLTGNLCRCTGYYSIIRAVERAASMATGAGDAH